jgi:hypothetical protein
MNMIEQLGYQEYKRDSITMTSVNFPPKLMMLMNNWSDSSRSLFSTLMILTNGGQHGVLITGPELHKVANISVPSVFNALKFLTTENWIIKEKPGISGNPNVYFINVDKIRELAGDVEI